MRNVISTSIKRPTLSMFLNITLSNELKINEVMTEFFIAASGFHAKRSVKEPNRDTNFNRLSYFI